MIKFCRKCQEEKRENCPSGYYFGWKDSITKCPNCGNEFIDIDFPAKDLAIIEDISDDPKFIESMIKLHETDIIEYNLKMSQFRNQAQQQQESSIRNNTNPHCPTCGSTNIKPIGSGERTLSVAAFGLLSKKINKSYKCLNCKYAW